MGNIKPRETLLPEHLRDERIPLSFAVKISGEAMTTLHRAAHQGQLRAVWFPAGSQKHWQVKVGDLVEYTGRPLPAEGLRELKERLGGETGAGHEA